MMKNGSLERHTIATLLVLSINIQSLREMHNKAFSTTLDTLKEILIDYLNYVMEV